MDNTIELKCLKCKWYMNDEIFKELYPGKEDEWFMFTVCGQDSDYCCAVTGYTLFEAKTKE